jgi:hypothetical protein
LKKFSIVPWLGITPVVAFFFFFDGDETITIQIVRVIQHCPIPRNLKMRISYGGFARISEFRDMWHYSILELIFTLTSWWLIIFIWCNFIRTSFFISFSFIIFRFFNFLKLATTTSFMFISNR